MTARKAKLARPAVAPGVDWEASFQALAKRLADHQSHVDQVSASIRKHVAGLYRSLSLTAAGIQQAMDVTPAEEIAWALKAAADIDLALEDLDRHRQVAEPEASS